MKLLFLTMIKIDSLNERNLYTDLLRQFEKHGHEVYIVSPLERRYGSKSGFKRINNVNFLSVKSLNLQKANFIEKGFGLLFLEYFYLREIKKHFSNIKFDLVLYPTPPITFTKVIEYIKKKDNCLSYLLLKDIFPQNAVDMRLIKKNSFLHRFFLEKEKKLYQISDYIGCLSQANVDYVLEKNPYIEKSKLEINPNTVEPLISILDTQNRIAIRNKLEIPEKAKLFIYGGNLGIPQGINFLKETIVACEDLDNIFFIVIGSGTEYDALNKWFIRVNPHNARLYASLPKEDYEQILKASDVGLIFLSPKFTIPNFPSRLLSYLEYKLPVIAATDKATDIGKVIENANCGFWVHSGDICAMKTAIERIVCNIETYNLMSENAYKLLMDNYTIDKSYDLIIKKLKNV